MGSAKILFDYALVLMFCVCIMQPFLPMLYFFMCVLYIRVFLILGRAIKGAYYKKGEKND